MKEDAPEVLRFSAVLYEEGKKVLLTIPAIVGKKLYDMEKVEGMIGGHPFRAPIIINPDGSYSLRVNTAMLNGSKAKVGERVDLAILGPEPDPIPPVDLQEKFGRSPEAAVVWGELTELGQRDWIRWIEDTKNPDTRSRRISRTVEQLGAGRRRACCVNVNKFMTCHIEEDNRRQGLSP